jgi:hypothetical protein
VFEFIDAHCRQILVHCVDAGVPGRLAIVGDEERRLVDAIDIAILRQVVCELRAGSAGERDQRVEDVGLIEQPFRPVVSPRMFSCAPDGRMASAEIAASANDVVRDKCGIGGLPLNPASSGLGRRSLGSERSNF